MGDVSVEKVLSLAQGTARLLDAMETKLNSVDEKTETAREEIIAMRHTLGQVKCTVDRLESYIHRGNGEKPVSVRLAMQEDAIRRVSRELQDEKKRRITLADRKVRDKMALTVAAISGVCSIIAAIIALLK